MYMSQFVVNFVICGYIIAQARAKFVVLNPSNASQQGANITTSQQDVQITNNARWSIKSVSDDTWNIVTQLDGSWCFHSQNISTLTFTINSPTAPGSSTFSNLLFAFSVPNTNKYIAANVNMYSSLFQSTLINRIVPRTDGRCPQLQDFTEMVEGDVTDVIKRLNDDDDNWSSNSRSSKLGLGIWDYYQYDRLNDIIQGSQLFPLKFTLENYPNQQLIFTYESITGNLTQQCIYEAFDTNQGLTVFFAVDAQDAQIEIDSISVTSNTSHILSNQSAPSTTQHNTSAAAAECQPAFNTTASWSSSYLSITIRVANSVDTVRITPVSKTMLCPEIFGSATSALIGDAVCNVQTEGNDIIWIIHLSSRSIINLDDSITIKNTAIECVSTEDINIGSIANDVIISSISEPLQPNTPNIIISKPSSTIGVCDDLILDARSTTNLGGRNNALFEWQISHKGDDIQYVGSYILVESDSLVKGTTYSIILTVTNWYGAIASTALDLYVSKDALPIVSVSGVTNITNLNVNEVITMFTHITFDESCLRKQAKQNKLQYDISWSVRHQIMDESIVHYETSLKLQEFLQLQVSEDVSVDAKLLQPCSVYIFNVNIQCTGNYECDTNAIHEVTYDCAPIQCKISTEDIVLGGVDPLYDLDFAITLDGDTFTYDPDATSSQNALQWSWNCVDAIYSSESCVHLLDSVDSSVIRLDLTRMEFDYDASYLFGIEMIVFDDYNINRDTCIDDFTLEINTIESNVTSGIITIKSFVVAVTSIASEINRNERLRLIGNIANYAVHMLEDEEGEMLYEWQELNCLLTTNDIKQYRQTSDENSLNLILAQDVLISGETYLFQLSVTQSDSVGNIIGFGASEALRVYILKEPQILSGSFQIEPRCNHSYESIRELLSTTHSLSVYADGDHTPLLYVFGYKYDDEEVYYLNPLNVYDSVLSDIYLPIGSFSIFVDVLDTKTSKVTQNIACSISLQSYSVCLDFEAEILAPFMDSHPLFTLSETSSFILQQSTNYMQYLLRYEDDDMCTEQALDDILSAIYQTTLQLSDVLCRSNSYIILLSQAITLWMDAVRDLNLMHLQIFLLDEWTEIMINILDPCSYITDDTFDVETLYVSQQSIVTKIPKIYHDANDVTNELATIVTNPDYHHLLYSLASSVIDVFKTWPSDHEMVVNNLLSDALYISELIRVSLSIPSETTFTEFPDFSIYSARANNQNIHVSLHDIDVSIPDTVTASGADIFSSVDVLIISIASSSNNNVSTTIYDNADSSNCNDFEGTLSNNSVCITLSGSNHSAHLASNINFTFSCEQQRCDDTFKCAWFNKEEDIWQNEGCDTKYDSDGVHCSCSHLTTFATIHNIHSYACDNNSYVDQWLSSWNGVHICMALVFLFIFLWTVVDLYPFYRLIIDKTVTWKLHRAVFGVLLISVTAFLQIIVQIQAYITWISMQKGTNANVSIKIYTLLMLLPQVTLFMLFTSIFYSWFVLSHGFLKNLEEVQQRLSYSLFGVNIFIWCFLIVYYVLICSDLHAILIVAAYIWSVMLSIAAIFMTIYSVLVGKVLYTAAKISQDQNFGQKDWKAVRRLLISNGFLTIYFVFAAFSTIYFAIDPHHQTVIYSTLYSCMDALCLLFIFWMYRGSLQNWKQRFKDDRISQFKRCRSDTPAMYAPKTPTFQRMRTSSDAPVTPRSVATMRKITVSVPETNDMYKKTELATRSVSFESFSHESCASAAAKLPVTENKQSNTDKMDADDSN